MQNTGEKKYTITPRYINPNNNRWVSNFNIDKRREYLSAKGLLDRVWPDGNTAYEVFRLYELSSLEYEISEVQT